MCVRFLQDPVLWIVTFPALERRACEKAIIYNNLEV